MILAVGPRSGRAFAPQVMRIAYVRGGITPAKMTPARVRVLDIAGDGLARSVPGLAQEADASSAVGRGLIALGALAATELPEFPPYPVPDPALASAQLS